MTEARISREIASLEEKTAALAGELQELYGQYLDALGHCAQQNLVSAGFYLCTNRFPELFLELSYGQRSKLQLALRHLGQKLRDDLSHDRLCQRLIKPRPDPADSPRSHPDRRASAMERPETSHGADRSPSDPPPSFPRRALGGDLALALKAIDNQALPPEANPNPPQLGPAQPLDPEPSPEVQQPESPQPESPQPESPQQLDPPQPSSHSPHPEPLDPDQPESPRSVPERLPLQFSELTAASFDALAIDPNPDPNIDPETDPASDPARAARDLARDPAGDVAGDPRDLAGDLAGDWAGESARDPAARSRDAAEEPTEDREDSSEAESDEESFDRGAHALILGSNSQDLEQFMADLARVQDSDRDDPRSIPPDLAMFIAAQAANLFRRSLPHFQPDFNPATVRSPEELLEWNESLEQLVQQCLRSASQAATQILVDHKILPHSIPDPLLEIAIHGEGSSPGNTPSSVVDFTVEMGKVDLGKLEAGKLELEGEEGRKAMKRVHVVAIVLRLTELEFGNPVLTAWRGKIRQLEQQLRNLSQQYQKRQRDLSVARAESAWRSSWPHD